MENKEQKPANKAQAKQKEQKPANKAAEKPRKKVVDLTTYENYTELKFIQLDGGQLVEAKEKELEKLESEVKSCDGLIPNDKIFKGDAKGLTASFGSINYRLLKGVPVPKEVSDFIKSHSNGYYFG